MNFRQLTFLLFIGSSVAYSDMAHAMNDDEKELTTPTAITRQLKNIEDNQSHLTSLVTSLKQQLEEQKEDKARMAEQLKETQTQLAIVEEMLRKLLTSDTTGSSTL